MRQQATVTFTTCRLHFRHQRMSNKGVVKLTRLFVFSNKLQWVGALCGNTEIDVVNCIQNYSATNIQNSKLHAPPNDNRCRRKSIQPSFYVANPPESSNGFAEEKEGKSGWGCSQVEADQYFQFLSIYKCHQETKSNFSSIIKEGQKDRTFGRMLRLPLMTNVRHIRIAHIRRRTHAMKRTKSSSDLFLSRQGHSFNAPLSSTLLGCPRFLPLHWMSYCSTFVGLQHFRGLRISNNSFSNPAPINEQLGDGK